MKFLDVFSYALIAFVLLLASALVGMTELWTPALGNSVSWVCQSLGVAFLVVGGTCTVCQKPVRDLSPLSVFWVTALMGLVMLIGVVLSVCNMGFMQAWPEVLEYLFFLGFLVALFTIPRSYYYD